MAAQITSGIIFVLMFALIIRDKIERQWITLGAGLLTIVLVFGVCMRSVDAIWETLNIAEIFTTGFWYHVGMSAEGSSGINWATIIFIAGMMVMVECMAETGFFRWLCMALAKLVKYKAVPIFIVFMILSAALSMFIDSITVILFLAAVTLELATLLNFDPVPMILAEVFCANLGGSATMCGDPPNIIIGTSLGYSFSEFLTNTGVPAGIGLIAMVLFFYFACRKDMTKNAPSSTTEYPAPKSAINNKSAFIKSCVIFMIAVVLLITHAQTGLTVAFIGVFIATLSLLSNLKIAPHMLKRVDYKTLLFFIGLFITVGGLEQTGVLKLIAAFIGNVSGGSMLLLTAIILWISAIASAFIDNIPFAATMVPVIRALSASAGYDLETMAWCLSLGTDIGGSATPIGASANVVGLSVAAKNGHKIGWGRYCKLMVPATLIVLTICTAYIWIRYV